MLLPVLAMGAAAPAVAAAVAPVLSFALTDLRACAALD
jgi:hypothetical protein